MALRALVLRTLAIAALALPLIVVMSRSSFALPEIRTHERNRVPACTTPLRLMRFMTERNNSLDPRFKDIAKLYKQHGEALRVRWDYAFFQMLLETNYLTYKTGSGKWGDVNPKQNNFAGIGTTGGGVPGDSFPDVSTGVLAQMQHLVAYSGERVDNPAARRTREKQDDIVHASKGLGRAVTFRDLTRRWATDRHYGNSIEAIADRFRAAHCDGPAIAEAADDESKPSLQTAAFSAPVRGAVPEPVNAYDRSKVLGSAVLAGAGPGLLRGPQPTIRPATCRVWTASYGGGKSILIRAAVGDEVHYTALQVLEGFERSLSESFIRTHAQGGEPIGEFPSREAALTRAFDLCPRSQQAGQ